MEETERYRKMDPTSAHPDWEQSLVDLLHGDMLKGWEGYEARLRLPVESKPQRAFQEPAWMGEPFIGKTLLVWAEQGLGDTFMFIRYLPLVKMLGGETILEAQGALLDVVATCGGADVLVPERTPLCPFDLQVS
ncbi:MAG: hypothetical protein IPN59_00605 [Holophaga sp.]|nr:hypothetical protein [Holophaga sp.]